LLKRLPFIRKDTSFRLQQPEIYPEVRHRRGLSLEQLKWKFDPLLSNGSTFLPPELSIQTRYSGCQKNVPLLKRFFLQPLMPPFLIPEHYYGKRYNINQPVILNL